MYKQWTNEEFLERLHKAHGDKFTPLEPYINASMTVKMRCNKCGHIWAVYPQNILKFGCPSCAGKDRRGRQLISNEVFVKRLQAMYGNEYTPLEKYNGRITPIGFRHNKCGRVVKMQPASLLNHQGCKYCGSEHAGRTKTLSNGQFLQRLKNAQGGRYTPLETYKGSAVKIKFKDNETGKISKRLPSNLMYRRKIKK